MGAPLTPLFFKELWEIVGGRALWTMLLLLCPLVGWSFAEALRLYGEASAGARDSAVVAASLSPLDGILVPTFGSFYVAVTLLFPFVAIRALGHEKEAGSLRLMLQLPYRIATLIAMKLAAVAVAWLIAAGLVGGSALLIWLLLGGHLGGLELANLLFGHLLYGLLIGAIALFAASISESAATAAIVALAFTIGSWVLDFTTAGSSGLAGWLASLSLTPALRTFEAGLLSAGLVAGMVVAIFGLCTLAAIWLPSGIRARTKLLQSAVCLLAVGILLAAASSVRMTHDVTEDQRNSFSPTDQRALSALKERLLITVHLSPEDPRYVDLKRNVLAKLERVVPTVTVRLAEGVFGARANDERYGEVVYVYGERTDTSRSTSPREVLPLIYALAGATPPQPSSAPDYPGYPLIAQAEPALAWFFGGLPLLIALCWWWCRRAPDVRILSKMENAHAHP